MSRSTTLRVSPSAGDIFLVPEVRIEGNDKVSGKAKYTADVRRPQSLWAAFTTSPFAHARIVRIDIAEARSVDGVRAVLTGADIGRKRYGRNLYDWPVLCYDVVRFVGDRVAAVAAETREAAERAAALIDVEYEELPAVFDPFAALEPDAPVLHPDRSSYYFKAFAGKESPVEAAAERPRREFDTQGRGRSRGDLRLGTPRLRTHLLDPATARRLHRAVFDDRLDRR